ncbi:MAG TPA: 5'/3'-nucleotidase SurE, partial [Treponemataceae bacterium]|nr:5'/3'-nucleotidase SurE [Treponemataceae bacterium]
VDCVVHGLNAVLKSKPDVILSGINFGANLGTDLLFSGTAAAARQASLYGIPGIAVSLESSGGMYDFSSLASFTMKNLEHLMSLCGKDIFVNINALSPGPYSECRLTKPSKRYYNDGVQPFIAPDGQHYSFFAGGDVETEGDESCDYCVVKKGLVSVSRILAQPSAHPCNDASWEKSCQMS